MDLMDKPQTSEMSGAPTRMRAMLASNAFRVGIVVLAAAIIFGAWAFAQSGRDEAPDDGATVVLALDDDYERARQAAESGDTDKAVEILERILAEDPEHERAAALLRQLRADQVAAADSAGTQSGGSGDSATDADGSSSQDPAQPDAPDSAQPRPIDDAALLAPVTDLALLLPQVITGWERGSPLVEGSDATVSFSPTSAGTVSRALYSVHDRGSVEGALAFIENTSKVAFSSNGADVRIGQENGYFGSDERRLATAVFARGRFAFEVVVTVPDGNPASARDAAIALAGEFEAAQ
ncbi:MAG: hypothetical protein RQ731_07860 [Anaerosomatales bacterium]|nr:hypothetical protein [Anaerosomatales bacterium]MDT8434652.1 hypothetical protein [Anaerosomatales bacterium]